MDELTHHGEILVVEDTPASLRLLAELLVGAGHTVREAPNGDLALWSIKARAPDVVLLDVRMPGLSGFEVCAQLKADPELCKIPVILMSAQSDMEDKVHGFQVGAIDFIGKPYQKEEVLARTAAHVRLARSQRALADANLILTETMAQLVSTRQDLERVQRLAALGSLVAGVAHQLNTPIGNCVLTTSILADRVNAFEAGLTQGGIRRSELGNFMQDTVQATTLLQRNLSCAARLIDSFKEVAVSREGTARGTVDVCKILQTLAVTMGQQLRAAGVSLLTSSTPLVVDTYPQALEKILAELIRNALTHGFGQGRGGTIALDAQLCGGDLVLSCTDDGAGIPAADLERVFEPFFTTSMGNNPGLGLHIVFNLVTDVLGGSIAASSTPGSTRFVVRVATRCPAPLADNDSQSLPFNLPTL